MGSGGNQGHQVIGNVTFDGKPVPKGYITFAPDAEKGNSGPGCGADIVDGKYATMPGKGVVGGAYRVKIIGYDGVPVIESGETMSNGKPLFLPFTTTVEFPKTITTKDFEVPLPKAK